MKRRKAVTLKDLSKELGLSTYTISKGLRGLPGMSAETRRRILEVARKRNYLTKEQERSLYAERIPIIPHTLKRFLFVSDSEQMMERKLQEAIREKLDEFGHSMEFGLLPADPYQKEALDKWVFEKGIQYIDGIFIAPGIRPEVEKYFLGLSLPKILINYQSEVVSCDSVIWDIPYAINQAVQHLFKNGHRQIIYVGSFDSPGFKNRWFAFQDAMSKEGIEVNRADHSVSPKLPRKKMIAEVRQKLVSTNATAVLCATHFDPTMIYDVFKVIGLNIPDDCSLIGIEYPEIEYSSEISHSFLLIRETGHRAAEKMVRRISFPHEPFEHIRIQGGLSEGNTVKNIST